MGEVVIDCNGGEDNDGDEMIVAIVGTVMIVTVTM